MMGRQAGAGRNLLLAAAVDSVEEDDDELQ